MKDDTTTQGNWSSAYGADGYSLAASAQVLPSYASFSQSNATVFTWAASQSDVRGLSVPGAGRIAASWYNNTSFGLNLSLNDGNVHLVALYALDYDNRGRVETIQIVDPATNNVVSSQVLSNFSNGVYLIWYVSGNLKINVTASAGPNAVISGIFWGNGGTSIASAPSNPAPPPTQSPSTINAVSFNGIDTTTQGAWKGVGNFNAPAASSSLVYGKDGVILPDTEGCDSCNPFPNYVSFGPQLVNSSTTGNVGTKPYSTHAYVDLVQGASGVMGAEPQNSTNTNFFQCNYTFSNPAAPWAPMVAWRPVVDTREASTWYTCAGITSFYLEFSFGNSTHNFEVYVVDDQNGGSLVRSEELQVLDGDTNAVLYDSGSFTNFTGGVYYKWSITGHVKINVINTSTNGMNAVINGVFFN